MLYFCGIICCNSQHTFFKNCDNILYVGEYLCCVASVSVSRSSIKLDDIFFD